MAASWPADSLVPTTVSVTEWPHITVQPALWARACNTHIYLPAGPELQLPLS